MIEDVGLKEEMRPIPKVLLLDKATKIKKKRELEYTKKLLGLYIESSTFKQHYTASWDEFISFLRGDQWPKRRPKHKVDAVLNFMLESFERKTAMLTDTKPIPNIVPRYDQFQDTANVTNDILSTIFEDSNYDLESVSLMEQCQVFGCGFQGTLYDKSLDNNRGGAFVNTYDSRAILFDPLVIKSYQLHEGEYVIIEDVWSLEKARDIYRKRADMIKPDAGLSRYRTGIYDKKTIPQTGSIRKPTTSSEMSQIPRVFVREYYLKDRQLNSSGNYIFSNSSRRSIMIGNVLVDDGENPFNDGLFPIDMMHWHTDFNSAFGWGDVELMKKPQELYNKLMAVIVENLMLMTNAIWIGDRNALTEKEWKKLSNKPGSFVRKNPGKELRREAGIAIPPQMFQILSYLEQSGEKITGLVDVMRGIRTGQVSSGVGIENLQLMAQALIRLRARAREALGTRVGRKLLSRIFQFYKPAQIFEIIQQRSSEESTIQAIQSELIKPINQRKKDAWLDLIFKIEPGSSLSITKQEKKVESFKLRQLESIDDEALLEDLDYPNKTKVLKRVEKKRQDAANAEVADGGPQGNAGTQFPNQAGGSPAGRPS